MSDNVLPPLALRIGRVCTWVIVGVVVSLVFVIAWVGVRGALAYRHLSNIQSEAARTVAGVAADPESAAPALARLAADTEAAHDLTSDPIWSLAEQIPWIGPQLEAFSAVSKASDDLVSRSLLPLATSAGGVSIDALKPVDGRVDSTVFADLVDPSQEAAEKANAAARVVEDIDHTPLLGVVSTAVTQAEGTLAEAASALDAFARASRLMPSMLGSVAPRQYVLLVQNNAEWRSLGGIAGTIVLLRADHGSITLVNTQSATELSRESAQSSVALPPEALAIYGTKPTRYFHNLTQIPEFPLDGEITRQMYAGATGIQVDGVLAMDPIVLSYLLAATGPVTLPSGDVLASTNAVPFLLNEVYKKYPEPAAQDAVFAGAAAAIFQKLLDGQGSAGAMISALARAGSEHRVFMWSADPAEQAVIDGTTIAGLIPVTDERTARFGVYLNDGTGSKMSYYVRPEVSLTWGACGSAKAVGQRDISLSLTLTSDAPSDAATSLPWYITGGGLYGTPPGIAKVIPNVYLPEGFELVSAQASDGGTFTEAEYQGRHVLTFGTDLSPGASATFTVNIRGSSAATEAEAFVTPTADASLSPTATAACGPGS